MPIYFLIVKRLSHGPRRDVCVKLKSEILATIALFSCVAKFAAAIIKRKWTIRRKWPDEKKKETKAFFYVFN